MRQLLVLVCAIAVTLAGLADAQSVVVPNASATVGATGGNNSLTRQFARTFQFIIKSTQLTGIPVGAVITGVSFRAGITTSNPATWPAADIAWKNYDIYLAEAAAPLPAFSTTFATNMKNPVQVHSGPLTIPKGSFVRKYTSGTTPNPFCTYYFDFQKPYVYKGGDLVLFHDHDGNTSSTMLFLEYVSSNATTHGMTLAAFGTYKATTATSTNYSFVIHRFHFGYGPAGCMGKNGTLNLIVSNNLVKPFPPPGTVHFAVTNGVPSAPGAIFVSPLKLMTPVPLPGGCNLLVVPAFIGIIPIALDAKGRFGMSLTFPVAAIGVEAQAYAADPSVKAGFVVTNGISFVVKP